jgi:hypothetical protein
MKFAVKGLDLSSNKAVDRTRLNFVICWIKSYTSFFGRPEKKIGWNNENCTKFLIRFVGQ